MTRYTYTRLRQTVTRTPRSVSAFSLGGDASACAERPEQWTYSPASEELVEAHAEAVAQRRVADKKLMEGYRSLFGALLHAQKYRPEISAALNLCGTCLTLVPAQKWPTSGPHSSVLAQTTHQFGCWFEEPYMYRLSDTITFVYRDDLYRGHVTTNMPHHAYRPKSPAFLRVHLR